MPTRRSFLKSSAASLVALACDTKRERQASGTVMKDSQLSSFRGATAWINSTPITQSDLFGRVALVQFWTFTCINWIRTLPYLRAWDERYRRAGLSIVGVHTPEFAFEHAIGNVRRAAAAMKVDYPIAVDSDNAIWNGFNNEYWPALYLFDADGQPRYHKFGEGDYDTTERTIQRLLGEAGDRVPDRQLTRVDGRGLELPADWADLKTPETYLEKGRATPRRITQTFHARDLNLVMGPPTGVHDVRFRVTLDGRPPGESHGLDVDEQGNGVAQEQQIYQLIRQPKPIVERTFEIEFLDPGIEAFVFTFG